MAKANLKRGLFITFEGPEGCGKSTHARLIYDYLKKRSYDCIHTREPGGTKVGEEIRRILLHSDGIEISGLTELFLFEAARSQIVGEVIKPNLAKKRIVICDRFSDATLSYQGYGGGIPTGVIRAIDMVAARGLKPDITILLDIDPATGLDRAKAKGKDRMESKGASYHRRVRAGYLKLAKNEPDRIKVIKAVGSIEETGRAVRMEIDRVIQRYKRAG